LSFLLGVDELSTVPSQVHAVVAELLPPPREHFLFAISNEDRRELAPILPYHAASSGEFPILLVVLGRVCRVVELLSKLIFRH
jgi:hypothetical protein